MKTTSINCQTHPVLQVDDWVGFGAYINSFQSDQVVVLTDTHVFESCFDAWSEKAAYTPAAVIEISPGEAHKTLSTCDHVWKEMHRLRLTRNSMLLCLGGGVVTDLGGFCASVFKRGIRCIHVPTSLLAQVDAAVGGKTGVDQDWLKNMIGTFHKPESVLIDTEFLKTLPDRHWANGFAEVIKHALIADANMWSMIQSQPLTTYYTATSRALIAHAASIKCVVIDQDPTEKGLRKILNFGHTFGHAVESVLLENGYDILHGEAIVAGMQMEALLSIKLAGLDFRQYHELTLWLRQQYGLLAIPTELIPEIVAKMTHDKKNIGSKISFSLLKQIGQADYDYLVDDPELLSDIVRAYLKDL